MYNRKDNTQWKPIPKYEWESKSNFVRDHRDHGSQLWSGSMERAYFTTPTALYCVEMLLYTVKYTDFFSVQLKKNFVDNFFYGFSFF